MSGLTHPHSFPSEEPDTDSSYNLKPLSIKGENGTDHSFLYPIGDSEDFYDPFSDLNLFLSKKIKKEMETDGSLKKWSSQIESNLLAKILPEFKKNFPKYRLGAAALKHVWGKVSYFYEKLLNQKGAITKNGEIDLQFIIKKNVNSSPPLSKHLPPYVSAHQIAVNISECIATIEGRKTKLEQLTKMIWAVQKHLLKNLSSTNAKSPYEQYDKLDKLIVKALLEANAINPSLSLDDLKVEISKTFHQFNKLKTFFKSTKLTSTLSSLLAKKFFSILYVSKGTTLSDKNNLEAFIKYQFRLSKANTCLSKKDQKVELVQRLLALCSIAKNLPKNMSENCIRRCVEYIHTLALGKAMSFCPVAPQSLFLFLSAQMHLMSETKTFNDLKEVQENVLLAYKKATELPSFLDLKYDHFEILIWKIFDEEEKIVEKIDLETAQILEKELANVFIDNPKFTFREIVQSSFQFFKKVLDLPLSSGEDPLFWETLNEKIDVWVMQNDMVCRWMHLNEKNPLFALLIEESKNQKNLLSHENFVSELTAKAEKTYPSLKMFQEQLNVRIWVFYKHLWYTSNTSLSSYECFLKWHLNPSTKSQKGLEEIVQKKLPYTPFSFPESLNGTPS